MCKGIPLLVSSFSLTISFLALSGFRWRCELYFNRSKRLLFSQCWCTQVLPLERPFFFFSFRSIYSSIFVRGVAVEGFEKFLCIPYDRLLKHGSVVKVLFFSSSSFFLCSRKNLLGRCCRNHIVVCESVWERRSD